MCGTPEAWHAIAWGANPQVTGSHLKSEPRRGDTNLTFFRLATVLVALPAFIG